MNEQTVQGAIQAILTSGLADATTLKGCTERQLADLETQMNLRLPKTYREFLSKAGVSAGQFMQGSNFGCAGLPALQPDAKRLLLSNGATYQLSASDLVFLGHQGYEFLWFDTLISDDPPVYLYVDGDMTPTQVAEHFSDWLQGAVSDEIEALRALQRGTPHGD